MPWRKYTPKEGKYGPIYKIDRGVQVRRDARGLWVLWINRNGQRKNRTIGEGRPALAKAIQAAEAIVARVDKQVDWCQTQRQSKLPKATFEAYSADWLKENSARWSPYTEQRYEQVFRLHLWPCPLFKKPIDKIGRKEIKGYLKGLARKFSPATVETVHGVISGVFNEAIDDELVAANPATGLLKNVLPPKNRRDVKPADPFNRDDLGLFLNHAQSVGTPAEAMMLKVMGYAGLRLGEALAMRYEHIDFDRCTYHVVESYKAYEFGRPKAGKMRLVDLPRFLVDDLAAYCRLLKKERLKAGRVGQIDLLFTDPAINHKWPYSQRKVQMLVKRVCKAAGLRVRNPHDLRHTYASLLLMAHQSPGYVQRQLGHSSISITMDIYCHWIPGEGRKGLEEALGNGPDACTKSGPNLHIFAYHKKGSR